jgi:hypothetical protein
MISSLNFALFPSNELFTFSKNVIALAEAKKLQIVAIEPFLINANTKAIAFQSALERESKNPLIKNQSESDKIRIDAFMTFRNYSESATTRRKLGIPEAADTIIAIIRKYTWTIQSLGQKARTAKLTNIISEIKTKHAAELTLIGGDELLDELTQAELDYELAFKKVQESKVNANEPTVAETRPEVVSALKSLFQIVGLQEIAAPSADVTALIASLNELITNSLSTVKATDTRSANKKKPTGEEPK